MKEYAIIRDYQADKMGLPFPTIGDFNSKAFEVIEPAFEEGYYYNNSGVKTASAAHKCAVFSTAKYSAVFLPVSSSGTTVACSGTRAAEDSGAPSYYVSTKGTSTGYGSCFGHLPTIASGYAVVSMNKDMNAPIIGVI